MVKITIGGRFIKPDGSAGFQQLNPETGQLSEVNTNMGDIIQQTDTLLSQSGKLSTGHLLVNQMQTAFDSSIAEVTAQLEEPGSGLVFDDYKTQLRAKADEVKSGFFQRIPQDGVNSNQINMLFDDYVSAKINSALTTGRKSANNKTREEFFASYKQLYNQAAAAPEDMVPHYMAQMNRLIRDAGVTGAFGASERNYLQKQATQELVKNRVEGLIERDPHQALEVIEKSGRNLGLSDEELKSYKDDAALVAEQFDRQRETDKQLLLRIEAQKKRQEFENARDRASRNEYTALQLMKDRNKFDPQQREEIKLQLSEAQRREVEKNEQAGETLATIDRALKAGPAAIGALDNRTINAGYQAEVEALEKTENRGLTLTERASLVSKYTGKEVSGFTASLSAALASGDQDAVVESLKVIDFLKTRNPAAVHGLKKDQQDAIAVSMSLLSNIPEGERTDDHYLQALQQGYVRTSKAFIEGQKQRVKDEIAFNKQFSKDYDINGDEFRENLEAIRPELRDRDWTNTLTMGFFGDPGLQDAELSEQVAPRFQEILKEKAATYGDTLPKSDIYAMAREEMLKTMGQIPHSADKSVYPFDPRKEFGPGADAIFLNAKKEFAAELAAQMRLSGENITAESLEDQVQFRPVQSFRSGLPTDPQGEPERSFIVMTSDGRMLTDEAGQPAVVKVSRSLATAAAKEQLVIDRDQEQLSIAIKNVEDQADEVDKLTAKSSLTREDFLALNRMGIGSLTFEEGQEDAERKLPEAKKLLQQAQENRERFENKIKAGKEDMASSTVKVAAGLSGSSLVQTRPGVSAKTKTNIRLETAGNPVETANKILMDRINSQNKALRQAGEEALESAQQLEAEYQRLRDLGNIQSGGQLNNYMNKIDTATAQLPVEFAAVVKNATLLSTRPGSNGRALNDSEKEAVRRVGTALIALGANSSPSEGRLLRAVGHNLGKVESLPESSIGAFLTMNRQVANAMTRLATSEPDHPVSKSLKDTPEIVEFLATTKEDKARTKQIKEINKMDDRGLQSTINNLQDAFNNLLPSLRNDQMEKANLITNKLNDLQFKKGSPKQVQALIKDIAELLGFKEEGLSQKDSKKRDKKNRFLGGK